MGGSSTQLLGPQTRSWCLLARLTRRVRDLFGCSLLNVTAKEIPGNAHPTREILHLGDSFRFRWMVYSLLEYRSIAPVPRSAGFSHTVIITVGANARAGCQNSLGPKLCISDRRWVNSQDNSHCRNSAVCARVCSWVRQSRRDE